MLSLPTRYAHHRTLAEGSGAVACWVHDRTEQRDRVLLAPVAEGAVGTLEDGRPFGVFEPETAAAALSDMAPEFAAAAWLGLGFLAIEQGDGAAALRLAERIGALPEGLGRGFPAAFARVLAGKSRVFGGDAAGADELSAGLEAIGALGSPAAVLLALVHWIEALNRLARWAEAEDSLGKARELMRLTGATEQEAHLARLELLMALGAAQAELAEVKRQGLMSGPIAPDTRERLNELVAAISAEGDLPGVLDRALAAFVAVASAERGFLLLYQGYTVIQQVFYGMTEADSDEYSSNLAYQVLWSGEPVFVEDAQADPALGRHASIQALGLRSVLGVPLFSGEEVIGVMLADSTQINTGFGPSDMAMALALARQVAIAIANVRRLEAYRDGYEELAVLHRLAIAGTRAADLESLMATVAAEVAQLSGAERVVLLEGEDLKCRAAFSDTGERLTGERAAVSSTVARWVFDQARPLHLLDAQSEEGFKMQHSVMALGLRTIEAVPVTQDGRTLGVLYTDNQRVVEAPAGTLRTLARMAEVVGAFLAREAEQAQ